MTQYRSQPYRLSWPLTASELVNIDEMFQILFDALKKIGAGTLVVGSSVEAWDADLDALAALASTGFAVRTAANTWAQRTIAAGANIAVTNGSGVAGNPSIAVTGIGATIQAWDADLDALAALASTGIAVRSASNTWVQRSIAAGANISVTNGSGASGNPTVAVTGIGATIEAWDADLDALAALASTGMIARTGAATYVPRTITAGAGISVSNGDGVSGNPTITATVSGGATPAHIATFVTLRLL